MMTVTKDNYYAPESNQAYWSVSQFKSFNRCEACGLAEARGEYVREETTALLVGGYIDAYFSGEMAEFVEAHPNIYNKRTGDLKADYQQANAIIDRIESEPVLMDYLSGHKQTIMTADVFGVPWKCKMDVYDGRRIVDLKIVRDFNDIYEPGYGYRSWIEYWGYDIQGAMYQQIERIHTDNDEPVPFYIVAATKERVPDVALIQIPQHVLDAATHLVEAKIDRFDLIKQGEVEPIRCEHCDYCKRTKHITGPSLYEIKEA
jgi:hypothetical protein